MKTDKKTKHENLETAMKNSPRKPKKVNIDIEKIVKQTPKSKKQHLIAINDENFKALVAASKVQGYTQHGVYLNDVLREFFIQVGMIEPNQPIPDKMIVNS